MRCNKCISKCHCNDTREDEEKIDAEIERKAEELQREYERTRNFVDYWLE